MTKTYYEYYCDSCNKKVDNQKDLIETSLCLTDEQCRKANSRTYDVAPRIWTGYNKVFCPECYEKYRNTISNFIKELSQFGIQENEFYTKEPEAEDDDLY